MVGGAPGASIARHLAVAPKTLGALTLLAAALPINLTLTAAALARGLWPGADAATNTAAGAGAGRDVAPDPATGTSTPRTVLISGAKMTKALQLARSFHRAGHRVILVENAKYRFTGHRFSRCVDGFYPVPPPTDPGYADALLSIVRRERVDVFVPVCSPAASHVDAAAKATLAQWCEVIHCDPDVIDVLDDKFRFAELAAREGLSVPDTHLITDPAQVAGFDFAAVEGDYVLKSIAYDPVNRLDLTTLPLPTPQLTAEFAASKPIRADNPWILQAFVRGQEYCTHSTVRDGRVQVYCCCESSAFQLNYQMVDKPEIEEWVTKFVEALRITGQVSFDFIQADDGRLYAIECNPRTHSAITMFYDHPGVARSYLEDGGPLIKPLPDSRPTYWIYQELWRLVRTPQDAARRLRVIAAGKDAIFDWADPLPFLMVHHLQIPLLLLGNLRRGKPWLRIDFNIGKLVEPAGD